MVCTEWIKSTETVSNISTFTEMNKWSWTDFKTLDPVPRTVRYRHHPRVSQSNPQLPRSRYNKAFRGHLFGIGRSKK